MTLKDRITDDMKTAMRARDADRLLAIRGLLAAIKQREIDERIVLDDAAVVAIVDRLVKQRKDSITQFEAGGRADLVSKETAELRVLEAYLPQRLGRRRDRGRGGRAGRRAGCRTRPPGRPVRHGSADGERPRRAWPEKPTWARFRQPSRRPWPPEAQGRSITHDLPRLPATQPRRCASRRNSVPRPWPRPHGKGSAASSTTAPTSRPAPSSRRTRRSRPQPSRPA